MSKSFVVDIDNTLIESDITNCDHCKRVSYSGALPIDEWVDRLNELYDDGCHITLWTGRGWDCEEITRQQLEEFGIKYHNLVMGKPLGVYVDRDAVNKLKDFQ